MSYYIIGIGGTGAKCVESLIHLCAAGLMPSNDELHAFFVDPDTSNGTLQRAQTLLTQYQNCRRLQLGQTELFKTPLTIPASNVWSPISGRANNLHDLFNYSALEGDEKTKSLAHLFEVLYTREEGKEDLNEGFRGHPAIGAAYLSATVKFNEDSHWKTFAEKLKRQVGIGGAKIVLCGSIFGGTGAAGIPTIGRLVRDTFDSIQKSKESAQQRGEETPSQKTENSKFRLGSVLMLPYFQFQEIADYGKDGKERLRANSKDFLVNTQAALKYYYLKANLNVFDMVYLLGENAWREVRVASPGSTTQRNEPHLLELYSALASMNFFSENKTESYTMTAREVENTVRWEDLPPFNENVKIKQKIEHFTKFASAYLAVYFPMLQEIKEKGGGYRAPWYIDFFYRRNLSLKNEDVWRQLENLREYCQSYLQWLADIEFSLPRGNTDEEKAQRHGLINFAAFADVVNGQPALNKNPGNFKHELFSNLLLPIEKSNSNELSKLWEKMCDASITDPQADGVGRFVNVLFRECGKLISR